MFHLDMMLLSIEVDPLLGRLVTLAIFILLLGITLRRFRQPYVIAYILTGILLGPSGLGVVTDEQLISYLGSLGMILLLFFIGMEISLPQLLSNWRLIVIGTVVQIVLSVSIVWLLGMWLSWPLNRVMMFAFVISLSSTAVVIKLLQDREELNSPIGQMVVGILIAQDISIVPMLIILSYIGGDANGHTNIFLQITGGIIFVGVILYLLKKDQIRLPFQGKLQTDHEMQVFLAFTLCFGLAIITSIFGLSSALGAFVAGLLISSARSTHWVHDSLHAFRVVFVALFFVSIGMIIDLNFVAENWLVILGLVLISFIIKQFINTSIFRIFKSSWRESFYGGALLSQIGEFSFLLGATGFHNKIIGEYAYQVVVSTIALTLLLSPFWIALTRKMIVISRAKLLLEKGKLKKEASRK